MTPVSTLMEAAALVLTAPLFVTKQHAEQCDAATLRGHGVHAMNACLISCQLDDGVWFVGSRFKIKSRRSNFSEVFCCAFLSSVS